VDLGSNKFITAAGTKGKPIPILNQSQKHQLDVDENSALFQPAFVRRYKVLVKKEQKVKTKPNLQKLQRRRQRKQPSKRKKETSKVGEVEDTQNWIGLGIFNGNFDGNTEVIHHLCDPNSGKRGVVARYIRFIPLSSDAHGFVNEKALRVRCFGHDVDEFDEPITSLEKLMVVPSKTQTDDEELKCESEKMEENHEKLMKKTREIMALRGDESVWNSTVPMTVILIVGSQRKRTKDNHFYGGYMRYRNPHSERLAEQRGKRSRKRQLQRSTKREMRQVMEKRECYGTFSPIY